MEWQVDIAASADSGAPLIGASGAGFAITDTAGNANASEGDPGTFVGFYEEALVIVEVKRGIYRLHRRDCGPNRKLNIDRSETGKVLGCPRGFVGCGFRESVCDIA